MGALAEKTLTGIREDISLTLQTFGITPVEADAIVHGCVPEASPGEMSPVCDMPALFTTLKSMGINIAVCTADSRAATIDQMNKMGVVPFLDDVICGNDVGIVPKPSPHCAIQICRRLGVELKVFLHLRDMLLLF